MAYRGGFQTKAVGVDFKSLTDRYVEGKNAAEKSREIVRAERREQSLLLDDSASKIDATNVTEMDNLFLGVAHQSKNAVAAAQNANVQGLESRIGVNTVTSNMNTNITGAANISELKNNQYKAIADGMEKGSLSGLTMEAAQSLWFTGQNDQVLKIPNDINDESAGYKTVKPKKFLQPILKMVGGNPQVFVNVEHDAYDREAANKKIANTEEFNKLSELEQQRLRDGIVTKTYEAPWSQVINQDYKAYNKVTVQDKSKSFLRLLGNRDAAVINGKTISFDYTKGLTRTELPSGDFLFEGNIAPELFKDLQNSVELYIGTLSDEEILTAIYDRGGFSIYSDKNRMKGGKKTDKDEINNTYSNAYDADGNPIDFKGQDPLYIDVNERGEFIVSEANRTLVSALIRDTIYKGMNVDRFTFRDNINQAGKGPKAIPSSIGNMEWQGAKGTTGSRMKQLNDENNELSAQHYLSLAYINSQQLKLAQGETEPSGYKNNLNEYTTTGVVTDLGSIDDTLKSIFGVAEGGSYSFKDTEISGKSIAGTFDNVVGKGKKLNVSSIVGTPMTNTNGILVVENPNTGITVHLTGDTEIAQSKQALSSAQGGGQQGQVKEQMITNQQVVNETFSTALTSNQQKGLWQELYGKNKAFKDWADNKEIMGKKLGSNPDEIDVAWQLFTQEYNQ
jgi:hypothetical protein